MCHTKEDARNTCKGCNRFMDSRARLYCDDCLPRRRPSAPYMAYCNHKYKQVDTDNSIELMFFCEKCLDIEKKEL